MILPIELPGTANLAKLLHEEEVRYREAYRMKADTNTLERILAKIKLLKFEMEHNMQSSFTLQ